MALKSLAILRVYTSRLAEEAYLQQTYVTKTRTF